MILLGNRSSNSVDNPRVFQIILRLNLFCISFKQMRNDSKYGNYNTLKPSNQDSVCDDGWVSWRIIRAYRITSLIERNCWLWLYLWSTWRLELKNRRSTFTMKAKLKLLISVIITHCNEMASVFRLFDCFCVGWFALLVRLDPASFTCATGAISFFTFFLIFARICY